MFFLFLKKETSLSLPWAPASCLGVFCLFQEQKKHLVLLRVECLLRNSSDTGCLLLYIASVWLRVSSEILLPFRGALKEVIKPSVFHVLRPQRSPLLAGGFPSSPFALFSRPHFLHHHLRKKHTHLTCSQIVSQ